MSEKKKSFELLIDQGSGYDQLIHLSNREKRYQSFLNLFLLGEHKNLEEKFFERPDFIDSAEIKALWVLNLLLLGHDLDEKKVFPFKWNEKVADEIARELVKSYQIFYKYIEPLKENKSFQEIDLYAFRSFLPTIVIYYSDFILREQIESKYEKLNQILHDPKAFDDLVYEERICQRYRLQAFYYRRIGDEKKADIALVEYRKRFEPHKLEQESEIIGITNIQAYPAKEILNHWHEILEESDQKQKEVLALSGVLADTCFQSKCADCCKYDFPTVSYTEFKYITQWLQDNNIDMAQYITKAKAIQEEHISKHGEPLKISDTLKTKIPADNPHKFLFTCPFLSDKDECTIHSARPLACRAFGLATIDGKAVQCCKYYRSQYENNASHMNERIVHDVRPSVSLMNASDSYLTEKDLGSEQHLRGTLVAWLTRGSVLEL